MKSFKGKTINNGIAMGEIAYLEKVHTKVVRTKITDIVEELKAFEEARKEASEQLALIYDQTKAQLGAATAEIFKGHQMMLEDEEFINAVVTMIRNEHVNAIYAIDEIRARFVSLLSSVEDTTFSSKAADLNDVAKRLITILSGNQERLVLTKPAIVVAEELSPSDTMQLDRNMILAFAVEKGAVNSHMAILAKGMGIPAVSELNVKKILACKDMKTKDGQAIQGILDGQDGQLIIKPDQETEDLYKEKLQQMRLVQDSFLEYVGKETKTRDGHTIKLYANIMSEPDCLAAREYDAEGIGLFRTEALFMGTSQMPSEDQQFTIYKHVVETMQDRPVVIRTLDIGADKQVDYLQLPKEHNPALGLRGIRLCLARPELLKTQLRAILRASAFGNVSVMFPMIISREELVQCLEVIKKEKKKLTKENIPFGQLRVGVMIETPAAALISDKLAPLVDFFSIGTNDLTQYTLAADRQNPQLTYNPRHDAVFQLMQLAIENGHKEGIAVGICGELAADPTMTEELIRMGVDELSVAPNKILPLRKRICES